MTKWVMLLVEVMTTRKTSSGSLAYARIALVGHKAVVVHTEVVQVSLAQQGSNDEKSPEGHSFTILNN